MKSLKVKEKLLKLPNVRGVFTKVRAVVLAEHSVADEFGSGKNLPPYDTVAELRAHQLEVELQKARAEETVQRARQRLY